MFFLQIHLNKERIRLDEEEEALLTENEGENTGNDQEISDYEKKRLENIAANKAVLIAMGIPMGVCATEKKKKRTNRPRNPRNRTPSLPSRASGRLQGLSAPRHTIAKMPKMPKMPKQPRMVSTRKRSHENDCGPCNIIYNNLPYGIKQKYPLMYSNSKSGLFYVHAAQKGWQAQLYINQGRLKNLVHIGMFTDRLTAGLAIAMTLHKMENNSVEQNIGELVRKEIEDSVSTNASNPSTNASDTSDIFDSSSLITEQDIALLS